MCWLEPGCGPSQSPWGHSCPEVHDGANWKELVLGLMGGLGETVPSREQEGSLTHLSLLVRAVLPAWFDVPAPETIC